MSRDPVAGLLAVARRRRIAIVLALALPWLPAVAACTWRWQGAAAAGVATAAAAILIAALAWRSARALDSRWLQRRLDAAHPALEDSSALLSTRAASLSPLALLQRERVLQRLPSPDAAGMRFPWPRARIAAGAVLAIALTAAALLWPPQPPQPSRAVDAVATPAAADAGPGALQLLEHTLGITPPAYTGLPPRSGSALDARVPEGAVLAWQLRFAPMPASVALEFLDGRRIALRREGDDWRGEATASTPGLYRIVATSPLPWADDTLYRIDVARDRPPSIRVIAPAQNLSLRTPAQRHWTLAFEAGDDHGIAASAEMHLTMTEGSGENIGFRDEVRRLTGRGDRHLKRFEHRLDLDGLGLVEGDDLIVHFVVRDNRAGRAQSTRSASHILRWPPPQARADSGIDGVLQRVLPAYFSSQRQIIIDAEALIAGQPRMRPEAFAAGSDSIAVDQRLLRLRYGQFLGEESEGAPAGPGADTAAAAEDLPPPPMLLPTNDAEDEAEAWRDMVAAQAEDGPARTAGDAHARGDDAHGHDHDHGDGAAASTGTEAASAGFGVAGDVLEEFGHTHDIPEAATLLDPKTRSLLRRALGEMWQSELALRQARPRDALPPANRALALVKEIQQADRIYLARTGTALPPVDFSRRLGGEREGITSRRHGLVPATMDDDVPAAVWRALGPQAAAAAGDGPADGVSPADLAALQAWLSANEARVEDPLSLLAAVDAFARDPGCDDCRQHLRGLLWPLVTPPPAAPAPRTAADGVGRAYLDALRGERSE
ncbi:DUF4175 domain-containing protein [Luteimonas terricola]|uniref:Membrane protein n=1 Tax=Luteimonas terricola TaxID=645597 RepID=A0ABQ2EBK1_9GAMM|nr:DUF4175 domain-containing protein [Luteimonas terricola]GGK05284.1 membrane protein [Luteimonas terricola]